VSATSLAAVLHGPGQLEIREFPLPTIGDDDGLLRVEATGVCGSDVDAYFEGSRIYQTPCILGHEVAGTIAEIGEGAAARWDVAVGDRVVVEEYLPCGVCRGCLAGDYQTCIVPRFGGRPITSAPSLWGGYGEYLYLPSQALVHKTSPDISPVLLQLYIPVSNGLHWVQEVGRARTGDTVVIVGPGPQGLGCVIGAREAGAGRIILVGREGDDDARLAAGLQLGADHVLSGSTADVVAEITELTGGYLADTVINAAGSASAIELSVAVAGRRATIVQAGVPSAGQVSTDVFNDIVHRLITVVPVLGRPSRTVEPALRLLESGRYPLEQLCTHAYDLDHTEQALRDVRADHSVIRAVVLPSGPVEPPLRTPPITEVIS
jgi:threonine dehydrogenase-like Zn-dependent dehydrogenase